MPLLDFKEIPKANSSDGTQDTFELFARDFFELLGYEIVREPSRGQDGGCDLIIEETLKGISGNTKIKWLVSCKHFAHSGSSVGKSDEPEIKDSVEANHCQGFIGFYLTLASSGLQKKVESIQNIKHQFFNFSRIEKILLTEEGGKEIAKRYFPRSYSQWLQENPEKAQLFSDIEGLKCINCGADITEGQKGIVVIWQKNEQEKVLIKDFYWCCKGMCDRKLENIYRTEGFVDRWEDIQDLRIATIYIRWVMGMINGLNKNDKYSEEAFEAKKYLLLELYPYVARNLTSKELEKVKSLGQIPSFLGGLGENF